MLEAACAEVQTAAIGQVFFGLAAYWYKQFAKLRDVPAGHNSDLGRLLKVRASCGGMGGKA